MKISAVGILHYNAQLPFFGPIYLLKPYNIRMVADLHEFGLLQSIHLLIFVHLVHVLLLDAPLLACAFGFTEDCSPECTLPKVSDFVIFLRFFLTQHFYYKKLLFYLYKDDS